MEDKVENPLTTAKIKPDNDLVKSLRLFLNFTTNVVMVLVLFVCVMYACKSGKLGAYELHIILCVLGYQGLMCQGILVVSKFNYWSIYLKRRLRIQFHLALQVASLFMVTIGTVIMTKQMYHNFTTSHGKLALCALVMSLASALDGIILMFVSKCPCLNVFWVKFGHYILGVSGLVCATASLCAGFKKRSFIKWTTNDIYVDVMIFLSCILTLFVLIEFSITFGNRIRSKLSVISV